jgi:hypothetical protein
MLCSLVLRMSTPRLYLDTGFVLDERRRIVSTREPGATPGPLFALSRSAKERAWVVRADVPDDVANEIDRLAREEPPVVDLRARPVYADRYLALLRDAKGGELTQAGGPALAFPDALAPVDGVVLVHDELSLADHFSGWVPGEIAAGRAPVVAVVDDEVPVSVCFCARRSAVAAEAGLDTAEAFRGRGFGPRVTAAWALAIRREGLVPLYSTSWTNEASLAVARKLGLVAYASYWNLCD